MRCEEVVELLTAFADRDGPAADPDTALDVLEHLRTCHDCLEADFHVRETAERLRAADPAADVAPDTDAFAAGVHARLAGEGITTGPGAEPAPIRPLRSASPARWAAAAAVLAAVGVTAWFAGSLSGGRAPVEPTPVADEDLWQEAAAEELAALRQEAEVEPLLELSAEQELWNLLASMDGDDTDGGGGR